MYQDVVVTTHSDVFVGVTGKHLTVVRLGDFPLNIKAVYVLAGVSPGRFWASGTLVNKVLNAAHKCQKKCLPITG